MLVQCSSNEVPTKNAQGRTQLYDLQDPLKFYSHCISLKVLAGASSRGEERSSSPPSRRRAPRILTEEVF
jgi:hypothetical protein